MTLEATPVSLNSRPMARLGFGTTVPAAVPAGLLALMLTVDSALIGADILFRNDVLRDHRFLLTTARGYGEIVQYVKFVALAAMLTSAAIRWKSILTLGWVQLSVFLAVDDAWEIHERIGLRMAGTALLPSLGKLRPSDLGELLFLVGPGVAVLGLALLIWIRGSTHEVRLGAAVLGGVALVAVFGVGMDVVHTLARRTPLQAVTAIIEDGGELLATSILVAAVVGVLKSRDTAGTS